MKFPKNRANCYVVERVDADYASVVCGVFSYAEEAEDFAEACKQEWIDKYPNWDKHPLFRVAISTFYG